MTYFFTKVGILKLFAHKYLFEKSQQFVTKLVDPLITIVKQKYGMLFKEMVSPF